MSKIKYLVILSLFSLASCEYLVGLVELKDNDEQASKALIGVWRGAGDYQTEEYSDWQESWKITRTDQGDFEVFYLLLNHANKEYEHSYEKGKWHYKDGHYYETLGGQAELVYKVYSVKKDRFEYNLIDNNDETTIQETKTVDDFQLQDPPAGYKEAFYDDEDLNV